MLEDYNKRDKNHLFELIGRRSKETPNFALLIGAGASVTSGVKTSTEMIDEWRRQLHSQENIDLSLDEWLKKQEWYDNDEEYSILFEKVCDRRSQRRIYIEDCVKNAKPSWGYIYLANIIAENYFNVVFTPNFDDLLNEACFVYADERPVVCAQDSAVMDIRITSARPKIIKLHGDFLYDDIKNTVRETESLEKNMRDKFMQFASEYGLVVIGYGGYDRSIMDILYSILRSGYSFPHGIYWCVRDENKISQKLKRLMRQDNIYWVKIDGFDEFMAELHENLKLKLPNSVRNPYESTTERLNKFIIPMKEVKHPIIKKDMSKLEEEVKKFKKAISEGVSETEVDKIAPNEFLAASEFVKGNYKDSLSYYQKALSQDPKNENILLMMTLSYLGCGNFEESLKISDEMININPDRYLGYLRKSSALTYMGKIEEAIKYADDAVEHAIGKLQISDALVCRSNAYVIAERYDEAIIDANKALEHDPESASALINKCIAIKRSGNAEEAKNIIKSKIYIFKERYFRAGAFAVINNKEKMMIELKKAFEELDLYRTTAKFDPEFIEYREDPDFKKLVYKKT